MMVLNNEDRADRGAESVYPYLRDVGGDQFIALSDLLADLQHFADRRGVNFEAALERSQNVFGEEKAEEEMPCGVWFTVGEARTTLAKLQVAGRAN
ncbi:hypothetical protein [Actinomadura sp. WMMB 499]|uniref:hypothetical protein n=1 Tax=Actinomadura sp. WMMB 499 TaxID=1219491 RepID=UPI0012489FCC|nr:hypothetical protein [Actinomadura sp. WMMB 499]QFG25426.1 hypothetical protein F7P10_33980 [Actinomadura sp. WMMB 499]